MPEAGEKVFSFESFTLDLRRGCLRREDREVELRPKSFEVLRYLVENAGRLVSKDELIRAVWPNVIVTDESLTRCVSDVRLAIGDNDQGIIKPCHGEATCLPLRFRFRASAQTAKMPSINGLPGQQRSPNRGRGRRFFPLSYCPSPISAAERTRTTSSTGSPRC